MGLSSRGEAGVRLGRGQEVIGRAIPEHGEQDVDSAAGQAD